MISDNDINQVTFWSEDGLIHESHPQFHGYEIAFFVGGPDGRTHRLREGLFFSVDSAHRIMRTEFQLGRVAEYALYGEHGHNLTREALGDDTPSTVLVRIERWAFGRRIDVSDNEEYGPYEYRIDAGDGTAVEGGNTMFWSTEEEIPRVSPTFTGCEFVVSVEVGDDNMRPIGESWFCVADVAMRKIDSLVALQRILGQGIYDDHGCELVYRTSGGICPSRISFRLERWNNGTKVVTEASRGLRGTFSYHPPALEVTDDRRMFWANRGDINRTHPRFMGYEFAMSVDTVTGETRELGESLFCDEVVALRHLRSEFAYEQVARAGLNRPRGCELAFRATEGVRPSRFRFRIGRWVDGECAGMGAYDEHDGHDYYPMARGIVQVPRRRTRYPQMRWLGEPGWSDGDDGDRRPGAVEQVDGVSAGFWANFWSTAEELGEVAPGFTGLGFSFSVEAPDGRMASLGQSWFCGSEIALRILEHETNCWRVAEVGISSATGTKLALMATDGEEPVRLSFHVGRWVDGVLIGTHGKGEFGSYAYRPSAWRGDLYGGVRQGRGEFWCSRERIAATCHNFTGTEFIVSVLSPSDDGSALSLPESWFCEMPTVLYQGESQDGQWKMLRRGLYSDYGSRLMFGATAGMKSVKLRYRTVHWAGGHVIEEGGTEEHGPRNYYPTEQPMYGMSETFWESEEALETVCPSFTGYEFIFTIETDDGTGEAHRLGKSWFHATGATTQQLNSSISRGRAAEQAIYSAQGRELVSEAAGRGRPTRLRFRIGQWVEGTKIVTDSDEEYGPYNYRYL